MFYNGRRINGRFDSLKAALGRFFRFTLRWIARMAIFAIAVGVVASYFATSTVTAQVSEPQVITVETEMPILHKIAACESSGQQFKDGQVLIHVNSNGTYDQGEYQINSIHNADATKRGFNLATQEGNEGYAKWMFTNLGSGDWASSSSCWHNK